MQIRGFLVGTTLVCTVVPVSVGAQIGVQRERNTPNVYAITNARIITVAGPAIDRGTVVVRNGVITGVGATVQVPGDARVIDGNGLTVYPGLIDANSQPPRRLRRPDEGDAGQVAAPRRRRPAHRLARQTRSIQLVSNRSSLPSISYIRTRKRSPGRKVPASPPYRARRRPGSFADSPRWSTSADRAHRR
jgi:hypothetical protein